MKAIEKTKAELLAENRKLHEKIQELENIQQQCVRAQAELLETRDQLQAVLDAIPGSVSWIDSDLRYLGINRQLSETFKLPPEKFVGQHVGFMQSGRAFLNYVKDVFSSSKSLHFKEIEATSGDKKLYHLIGSQKYNENTKAVFVGIDITQQKEIEHALRLSEEKYRKFFEEDLTGDYISSPDGKLIFCNSAFAQIFGYESVQEALRHDLSSLYPSSKARKNFIAMLKRQKKLKLNEVELRSRDGRPVFVVENTIGTFDDQGELIEIRGYIFDITERKKLEDQVRQAQKMEAIGTLAGGIAHDFNNLLTTIQGYSDLALTRMDDADPVSRNLHQIRRAATRAASLTNQLLLFSRKQSLELNTIEVNEVIENMLKMLQRLIGEDIEVRLDLKDQCWSVWGDVGNIEQIIMNLVVNARDAMPKGGSLIIRSENHHIGDDYCNVYNYARPGKFVCLSISDNGMGMEESMLQHIFEPFFTTKELGKGTGLGLSVVYGIVKQHEGWINVHSTPGIGTTFEVFLPATTSHLKAENAATVPSEDVHGNGERILLVEDESAIREFSTNVLTLHGYRVMAFAGAREALTCFEQDTEPFDLVFSDVVLPDMDGLELISNISRINPSIRIALSSGYTDQKSQWPEIRSKGYPFLQKPYSLHDLLNFIYTVLH